MRKKPKTATTRRFDHLFRVLVFPCLLLILSSSALPQDGTRSKPPDYAFIFGTVWGPDDRPVAGMKVKIRRAEGKKTRWELYSNRRGEFEQRVPAGKHDYVISADTRSYKLPHGQRFGTAPEVTVHVENNERADTGLHLK